MGIEDGVSEGIADGMAVRPDSDDIDGDEVASGDGVPSSGVGNPVRDGL